MINHITLNTGSREDFIEPPLFLVGKVEEGVLPEPYDRYSITTIFQGDSWLYFDLFLDESHITANMVCLGDDADQCWGHLTSLYLQIYRTPPQVSAVAPSVPWLATVVLPNTTIFQSQLIAKVEQAIALSSKAEQE